MNATVTNADRERADWFCNSILNGKSPSNGPAFQAAVAELLAMHRVATLEVAAVLSEGFSDMCAGSDDPQLVTACKTGADIACCIRSLRGDA